MTCKLTVAGVDQIAAKHILLRDGITTDAKFGDRATAKFTCVPGYVPNRFDEVVVYAKDGVTPIFGGVVNKRTVAAVAPQADQMVTQIDCTDWWTYADWTFTSHVYAAPVTLKQVLTDLITDCLGAYGITLDPAQVVGPTLDAFSYSNTKASDALRALTNSSGGYVAQISPGKVLSMTLPGGTAAPVSITDAAPHCTDFVWEDPDPTPANRIILTCGVDGLAFEDDINFTANGVDSSWTFDVGPESGDTFTSGGGGGTINVGGVVKNESLGDYTWTHDTATALSTLTLPAPPAAGTVIDFKRNIQPPFVVIRKSGATPPINYPASDPTATTVAAGAASAAGLLAQLDQDPRTAIITNIDTAGWAPGQAITVNYTKRDLVATVVITEVQTQINLLELNWVYTITAIETTTYQASSPLDLWRTLLGSTTGTVPVIASSGGGSASSLPVWIGGSSEIAYETGGGFIAVPNAVRFSPTVTGTYALRAAGKARHAGVSVTLKLRDLTAGTDAIAPAGFTSTVETIVSLNGTLTAGHDYQLQIEGGSAAEGVFCTWGTITFVS